MLKALIVDDSRSARFSLKKSLEKLSVLTEEAGSGQEALLLLQRLEYTPDIIFMDHYMPDLDGFEVTKRLKAGKWAQIPIFMCSSRDDPDYHHEALAIGANGTIAKPAKYDEIEALIEKTQNKTFAIQSPTPTPAPVSAPPAPVSAPPAPTPTPTPTPAIVTDPYAKNTLVAAVTTPAALVDEEKITDICQSLVSFHFKAHQLYVDQQLNEKIQAMVATQLDARLNMALEDTVLLKTEAFSKQLQKNEVALSTFQIETKQQLKQLHQEIESIQPALEADLTYDDHAIRQSIDKISKEIGMLKQSFAKEKSMYDHLVLQVDNMKKHLAQPPSHSAASEKELSKEINNSLTQIDKALQKEAEKRSSGLEQLNEKVQLIENKVRHEVKLLLEYGQEKQRKTQILIYSLIGITAIVAVLGIVL